MLTMPAALTATVAGLLAARHLFKVTPKGRIPSQWLLQWHRILGLWNRPAPLFVRARTKSSRQLRSDDAAQSAVLRLDILQALI